MVTQTKIQEEENHNEVMQVLRIWLEHYKDRLIEYKIDEEEEKLKMIVDNTVGPYEGLYEEWGHMFYLALLPHSSGEKSTIILEHLPHKCRICNPAYYEQ